MTNPAADAAIEIRTARAGRGVDWISEGYELFRRAPGTWIGLLASWILMTLVLALLGAQLVMSFLDPVMVAGIMLGTRDLAGGGRLRVGHLFEAFRGNRVGSLLMVVVIQLGLGVLVGAVVVLVVVATMTGPVDLEALMNLGEMDHLDLVPLLLGVLVALLLGLPLVMMAWFAPALIILRGMSAWPAMKLSLRGFLQNWLSLGVYGLVAIAMLLLAALPLLLGLLVALPVLVASVYTSYRDIYPEAATPD